MSDHAESQTLPRSAAWVGVAALMAFGLTLRWWDIRLESAWWDEYSSLVHLKEPTLWSFLVQNRTYDPATLPLYYTLEYLWSRLAGTDTLMMRLPSLALGIAIIPAVYALGARLFTRQTGIIAAALLACSPVHAFHAQGIRMYVLFTLLAVLSVHTFVRAWRDERPLWPHLLVQFLLSWTHPFALLVPAVEGAAWLLTSGPRDKRLWRWTFLCAIAWLPAIAYLATVRYYSQDLVDWLNLPTVQQLLNDIFTDDVVTWDYSLLFTEKSWNWLPLVRSIKPVLDGAFALSLVGAAVLALVLLARDAAQRPKALLLALWVVLPVLALLAGSLLLRPMYAPRYTLHSSVAMYLLAAAAIAALPAWPRRIAAALLVALMLFQTTLLHPGPQRTNYLGAAAAVRQQANPATDVLLVSSSFEYRTFLYNFPDAPIPALYLEGTPLTYLAADRMLSAAASQGRPLNVWLFHVIPYWERFPERMPQEVLPQLGLKFDHYPLPAIQGAFVLRITGQQPSPERERKMAELEELVRGYAPDWWPTNFLNQCAAYTNSEQTPLMMMAACQCLHDTDPVKRFMCNSGFDISEARARAVAITMNALSGEDMPAAAPAFEEALRVDPTFGMPHLLLSVVAAQSGKPEAAFEHLQHTLDDPFMAPTTSPLVRSLEARDMPAALLAIDALSAAMGPDLPQLLKPVVIQLGKAWGVPVPEAPPATPAAPGA